PIFVSLLAWLLLNERHNARKYIGIFLGFLGLLIFSFGKLSGDSWLGIFFGIFAAVTFALYTVLMKKYTKKYGSLRVTAFSSLSSGLIYALLLSVLGKFTIPKLSIFQWCILVYLGVVVTGIAYLTFFKAMEKIGATQSSRVFFLKPIVATVLAVILLGEKLGLLKIFGMVIVLFSLIL
ncbi:MAG: DMT family transporter, partial [Fervidobacterium sp.]